MYHKLLRIALFGAPTHLADVFNAFDAARPQTNLTLETAVHPTFEPAVFANVDIAFIDADAWQATHGTALRPAQDLAAAVEARRKEHGRRFCYLGILASPEQLANLTPEDIVVADDIWLTPLPQALVQARTNALLARAAERSELLYTTTCLDTLIDAVPDMVWFKTLDGTHVKVNASFCSVVAKSKDAIEGRKHNEVWDLPLDDTQSSSTCARTEEQAIAAGRTCTFEEVITTNRGPRRLKTYKAPLYDENGEVMGTVGLGHDTTDLSNMRNELDILIDALPLSVVVEDIDNRITNINRLTERYFTITREESIGRDFSDWRRQTFGEKLARVREHHESQEFLLTKEDQVRLLYMRKAPLLDVFGNRTGRIRLYSDMTNQRELENQALQSARTDYLTGLYNRRYFYEYLDENDDATENAIVMLDLDNFKGINDAYGHAVGDRILKLAAHILSEVFFNRVVVRWGGDEFLVSIQNVSDVAHVTRKTQQFLDALAELSGTDDEMCQVTGSAGIALDVTGKESIDRLIKRADDALYEAKAAGRSCVRVSDPASPPA